MFPKVLVIINSFILLLLSVIHFYWAFGGQWGFATALPTNEEGKRVLNPKKIDSLIVAIGLSSFATYLLVYSGWLLLDLPSWIFDYGIWVIIIIFLLRAIGDFKYVGLFKRVKNTDFSARDKIYYSPLCLWLSFSSLLIMIVR